MKLPNWLAWFWIRLSMEVAVLALWLKGMDYTEARRRVGEVTMLYMHKEITPQFGARATGDGEGESNG